LSVVPILLLANVCFGIYLNQSIWYKLSGQTKFGAYIALGGGALTIVVNVMFIPTYGYMASAWATLLVYASQMVASYMLSRKYYPIHYNLRKFFLYTSLAIVLYFVSLYLNFENRILFYVSHNLLIVGFIYVVYVLEYKGFKRNPSHS
jgi:O-antigen/teichoic acid export membrane protein